MEPIATPRVFSGRYELTHLIARGGMAEVYRAQDRRLDRPVALKVLFPELSVDRTFVERFRREAQAAAKLSHPNIVPVFDWGEDDGTYFIVMEYIDGQPLSALLRSAGAIEPVRAATITAPVAAALAYAHRHGVIHRDVKPGNVLLTDDGTVKVTDFGIARAVNTEESLTQTGAVMGTATYFSPEQAEGHGVDARSDVYSLGVVLFEMLTGRPPFLGETPVSVASKHVRDLPPMPRDLNPAIPVDLENVVMMAMAKSPDQRYPTAEAFRLDLVKFVEGRAVSAGPAATGVMAGMGTTQALAQAPGTQALPAVGGVPAGEAVADDGRRRTRRLALLLLLLLAVLGVIIYFLGQSLGYWGASVSVPNVVGQSAPAARSTLQADGLSVGPDQLVRSTRAVGTVTGTRPPVGSSVSKGSSVTLLVSGGPNANDVTVPAVTNQPLATAEATLRRSRLRFTVTSRQSAAPVNTVIGQNPAAGAKAPPNSNVALAVSGGQTVVPVPDVAGDSPAHAGQTLASAGFQVGTTEDQTSTQIQQGLVIGTDPPAGTPEPKGATINVIVSTGVPTTIPPPTTTTTAPPPTTTAPPPPTTTTPPPTTTTTPPTTTTPTTAAPTPTAPTTPAATRP